MKKKKREIILVFIIELHQHGRIISNIFALSLHPFCYLYMYLTRCDLHNMSERLMPRNRFVIPLIPSVTRTTKTGACKIYRREIKNTEWSTVFKRSVSRCINPSHSPDGGLNARALDSEVHISVPNNDSGWVFWFSTIRDGEVFWWIDSFIVELHRRWTIV